MYQSVIGIQIYQKNQAFCILKLKTVSFFLFLAGIFITITIAVSVSGITIAVSVFLTESISIAMFALVQINTVKYCCYFRELFFM